MEKQFNQEQLAVIGAWGGRHLVLAPPGCGKTAVLARRIVAARQRGVDYADMACLTFTNRASRGMKERIMQTASDEQLDKLFVGNVHRFCSQFLFANGLVADESVIIDTDVSISIIADYLGEDELRILGDAKQCQRYSAIINLQHLMFQCCRHHPAQLMVHRDALPAPALRELCMAFSLPYTQASAISLYEHAADYRDNLPILSADANRLLTCLYAARCYEQYKQAHDLLDFEDLLLLTYEHLQQDEGAAPPKLHWLQVDEVQDLNPLQLAIIELLTAPDATVVYLGDAQQAIFSFMGAKMDTLEQLRLRCGKGGLHNFFQNYRSPRYLLDVFNDYAGMQLGMSHDLLPQTQNEAPQPDGALRLLESFSNVEMQGEVARLVEHLYETHPQETTAVIVAFNSDADEVSGALQLPHFKISGADLFSTPDMQLLLAHLNVVHAEQNFISWSRLLTGLRIYSSNSAARQFVHAMMSLAVSPTDFLRYSGSTYVAEFLKVWEARDLVVFDTETTGLDVFQDDVVQIAALRVRQGQVVDELNVFVETSRDIPAMLGDIENPLRDAYARQPHLSHEAALRRFLEFAEGAVLLGHNVEYDWHIMQANMQRYAPALTMPADYFDSLKLARLLRPRQHSYKLKSLLEELNLEGQNSHLADDDIRATLSLACWCHGEARGLVGQQLEFVSRHRQTAERLRNLYGGLYAHARNLLYQPLGTPVLADELCYAYDYLRQLGRMGEIGKLHFVTDYVRTDMLGDTPAPALIQQLDAHMQELNTMKEADLCGSKSMQERIFVSTVHKAKGLEFDNVIVYDVVEGKYPSHYATTPESRAEEARKLYVAMSRARRRLILTHSLNYVSPYGRVYPRQLSPFMQPILHYFQP